MTLKFTFLFQKSNKDFFLKILQTTAQSCNLKSHYIIMNDELYFFAIGESEDLGEFSSHIAENLPLSLYFIFKNVEVLDSDIAEYSPIISHATAAFEFSVSEMQMVKNYKAEQFCDIFEYPMYPPNVKISYQNQAISDKIALRNALESLCDELKNHKIIRLKTTKGNIALSLFSADFVESGGFDFVMVADIASVLLYTRADSGEIDALGAFEKPFINLRLKEVFATQLGFKKARFVLPYDIILNAIFGILESSEINLLYAKIESDNAKNALDYEIYEPSENLNCDNFFEIIIGAKGYFVEKNFVDLKQDCIKDSIKSSKIQDVSDFLRSNFGSINEPIFVAYISQNFDSKFCILDSANVINIEFDTNPKHILSHIAKKPSGERLIENYKRNFPALYERIESFGDAVMMSRNITDILGVISFVLGLSESLDKAAILECADSYLREIGPRIDFKSIQSDGGVAYDCVPSVQSAMSFLLAGMESEVLSYGVLDSLADFCIATFRDASVNHALNHIGIAGDLFANNIFFKKITAKMPQNLILHFPINIDLKCVKKIEN